MSVVKSNHDSHLVIFTYSFPFGTIEQWLETEIIYTAKQFERITIVPSHITSQCRDLPTNVSIDTTLATSRKSGIQRIILAAIHALRSPIVYQEIFTHPWVVVKPRGLRKLLIYHDNAHRVADWLIRFLKQPNVDLNKIVMYTVWLVPQSIGISMVKRNQPKLRFISRAHRDDLYESDNNPPYLPFRKLILQSLNKLFVISEHGLNYVRENYASFCPPCEISRVGIKDPGFDNNPSADNVFRIVSCSFLIPVKRLDLFIQGLKMFAVKYPMLKIDWQHIGDGPLRNDLAHLAQEKLQPQVQWKFIGHLSNTDVMTYYRDNPVDTFVNVSESEGIPAAIMEAQSCGIPCIATSVGGNPEIVNNTNGVLLSSNPTPTDIAEALAEIKFGSGGTHRKRSASKSTWQTLYNASQNYEDFANRIVELFS